MPPEKPLVKGPALFALSWLLDEEDLCTGTGLSGLWTKIATVSILGNLSSIETNRRYLNYIYLCFTVTDTWHSVATTGRFLFLLLF